MYGLGDAMLVGAYCGVVIGAITQLVTWVVLVADFRAQILSARRGVFKAGTSVYDANTAVVMHNAPRFVGYLIGNALFSFILLWFVCFLIFLLLSWQAFWAWFVLWFWPTLGGICIYLLVSTIASYAIREVVYNRHAIRCALAGETAGSPHPRANVTRCGDSCLARARR